MKENNTLAWVIAALGIGIELFIATLDLWFPSIPHLVYQAGDGFKVIQK